MRTQVDCEQHALFAIPSTGAYGLVMSSNYNSRPRAAEVLVDGDRIRVIRERETYKDRVRGEVNSGQEFCAPFYLGADHSIGYENAEQQTSEIGTSNPSKATIPIPDKGTLLRA